MPPKEWNDRHHDIYFSSAKERNSWLDEAQKFGLPLTKYILEMADRGRRKETARPHGAEQAKQLGELREENHRLRSDLHERDMVIKKQETELFKLRHVSILQPGESPFSEELVGILREGHTMAGPEILRLLKIDPGDSAAVQIVYKHLQLLEKMGLANEGLKGWRWME